MDAGREEMRLLLGGLASCDLRKAHPLSDAGFLSREGNA